MGIWSIVSAQFGKPRGVLGRLAGAIMASRGSNRERSAWAIELLKLAPTDVVLETGFGPGLAIHRLSEIVTRGKVFGLDHSALMVQQATARNRAAIDAGRVKLALGSASTPPDFGQPIDKVLDVNSFQFWDDQVGGLRAIRSQMRSGGVIALVHQPRRPGYTEADALAAGKRFAGCLREAGFVDVQLEQKEMKPVLVVGVLARKAT